MSRLDRVKALLQQEISDIIVTKVSDNKIGFVTITDIDISPDIRNAKVYFSHLGSEESRLSSLKALNRAARFIQGEVGRHVHLKTIPNLEFIYDPSIERGFNIVQKIDQIEL